MTLRRWSIGLLVLMAVALAGCPEDEVSGGSTDATVDGAGDASPDDGTADTGADVGQPDTGKPGDAGNAGAVELVALTEQGPYGAGLDAFTLTSLQEPAAHGATPGFQMDFQARTIGIPKGTQVTLSVDGVDLGTASVDNDAAAFDGITLAPGLHAVEASVSAGTRIFKDNNAVTVSLGQCPVSVVADTAGCLTVDADPGTPGFQATFVVQSDGGKCKVAYLEINGSGVSYQTEPVQLDADGKATITANLSTTDAPTDKSAVTVTAVATWPGAESVEGQSTLNVEFDTLAPTPTVTAPVGPTLTMADDESPATPGITVTVRGTIDGATATDIGALELLIDGISVRQTTPGATKKFEFAPYTFTENGDHTLQVKGQDSCGLTGETAEQVLDVQLTEVPPTPTIDLVAATAGGAKGTGESVITLVKDDEPAAYVGQAGFQMDFQVVTVGVPAGAGVTLVVAGAVLDGSVDLDGIAHLGPVNLTKGDQTATATVVVGGDTLISSKTVSVDIAACDIVVEPAGGCLTDDASPAPGLQASIKVSNPDGKCDTASVEVVGASGQKTTLDAALEGGEATFLVTLAPAGSDDQPVTLTATVSSTGDASLAAITSPIVFVPDGAPPVIAFTEPADGVATVADDADGDPSNGIQIALVGTVGGNQDVDGPLPLTVTVDGEAQDDAAQDGATWTAVATVTGVGTFEVVVATADGCGLQGSKTLTLTVGEGTPPTIDFLAATANGPVGEGSDAVALAASDEPAAYAATPGYQMDFTVLTTGVPEGATVTLKLGGASLEAEVDATGSALFGGVALVKGDQLVEASVTVGGATASSVKTVTVDIAACDLVLEPVLDACLTDDSDVADGFQAAFVVSNPDGNCDTAVLAVVDTEGTAYEVSGALDAQGQTTLVVTLAPATPVDGLTATVTARVESSVDPGLLAQGNAVSIVVDDTAPTPALTAPVAGTITDAEDLDGDPSNGVQIAVSGTAGGATAVVLAVDGTDQDAAIVADGAFIGTATLAGLGAHTITAKSTDGCGLEGAADVIVTVEAAAVPTIDLVAASANGPVGEGEPSITLGAGDEPAAYTDVPGFQMDFAALTTDVPEGTTVTLTIGGATLLASVDAAGVAVFSGVNLTKGAHPAAATVTVGGSDYDVAKDVLVDIPACDIVVEPADSTCLTEDASADAGFQSTFVVKNPDGQCDVAGLVVTQTDGTKVTLAAALIGGEATFTATLATGSANGGLALVAGAVDSTVDPGLAAQTSDVVFTVDTMAPQVTMTLPANDTVLTSEDLDGVAANGIQILVGGTSTGATQVELMVAGVSQGVVTPVAGGSWSIEATFTGPGAWLLDAQATDACGLAGSDQRTLGVAEPPIEVAIVAPADGSTLFAKDDGDPVTQFAFETTFTVTVDRPAEGGSIQVQCADGTAGAVFATVGAVTLTQTDIDNALAGAFDVAVTLDTRVVGSNPTICKAAYNQDNTWESSTVSLIVALPAPAIVISAPTDGSATTEPTVTVTVFAENLDGVTPTLTLTDAGGAAVGDAVDPGAIAAGALTFELPLSEGGTQLPDGDYTLTLDATDGLGNVASEQSASVTTVTFTLDTTAPVVALTAPAELLQPLLDPAVADEDPATPGYQTTVSVSVSSEEPTEDIQVCLTVSSGGTTCANPAPGASSIDFAGVTLVPGANTLAVEAFDPLDNKGVAQQTTTLELDTPVVTITSPDADSFVTTATIDVVITVADVNGVAIPTADVDILVGGTSAGVAGTEGPDGTWTFTGVAVADGANEVQAVATSAGLSGASQIITINRKTTEPSIGITTPTDLQTLNLSSTVCQTGVKACILDVQATVGNVADAVTTTLSVTCGAVTTDYDSEVTSGLATWAGVPLPDQATCTMTASVTDKAGQTATSAQITVSVDRTGPVLNSFPSPTGAVIEPPADEDPTTPGLQKKLQVSVTGLEANQIVSIKVIPDGADPSTVDATIFATVPSNVDDATKLTVEAGILTITTSGYWTLQADASDKAGNVAASLSRSIYFNVDQPIVAIVSPTDVEHKACTVKADCGAAGICEAGFCALPWNQAATRQVKAQLSGIALGTQNVRICSDGAGGGAACATPGFTEVARGDVTSTIATLDVASIPDGLVHLVAEAETFPGNGTWVSSLNTAGAGLKDRWVYIDSVPPVVTGITSPSDTLPPTMVLNQAEQVSPGNFDFAVSATDSGQPFDGSAVVYSNAQVKTTLPMTAGAAGGAVNFVSDGVKKMQVVVSDSVGNTSTQISNPAAFSATYTIKVAPLTLTFSAPTKSPILASDSRAVTLSSNQTSGTVTVFDGGVEVATASIGANGTVTFDHATFGLLSEGTHTLTATLTDTANNTIGAATVPPSITVDTVPPTLTVTSPVAGSLGDTDDAAPTQGGFQIATNFTTSGAATWKVLLASGCASDYTGCGAATEVAAGAVTNPGGAEPTKLVTLPILAATTWHRVTVEARDALGNKTSQTVDIEVVLTSCILSFANLPADGVYNAADCAGSGCSSIDAALLVQFVGPCGGVDTLTLYKDGVPVGQETSLAAQEATFPLTFADGEQFTLWAELTTGGSLVAETGQFDVMVDLTAPSVAFVAANVLGFQTPASGATEVYGMAADQTPGSVDTLEIHLRVTATDADGGRITGMTATSGAGTVALATGDIPADVVGAPSTFDFQFVSLPDQGDYTVTVLLEDAAGNAAVASFQATVDISPPEEVVLEPIDAATDVAPRLPAVTLTWQPPASNTGIAGGAAALYEVRYSTSPIDTDADWTDACKASDLPFVAALPTPGDPTGAVADTYVVRGPDPRSINTAACKFAVQPLNPGYYFAVRAQDAAGNWSPISGAGTTFTDATTLNYAKVTHSLTSPNGNTTKLEDKVWAIGDINGDGYDDAALGGQTMSGFCIIYGKDTGGALIPDLDLAASSGPGYQCLLDASPTAAGFPIVSAGDINGDGQPDLAVGAGIKAGATLFPEEVRLYLGNTGGGDIDATPVAIIRGTSNNALYGYKNLNSAGNFNGDAATGSGLPIDDVIIPSGLGNKVFVVPGSESFVAGATQIIDLNNAADRATWNVVTISMIGAAGNAYFGWSVAGAGDILPDAGASYDEVVISMAKDPAQAVVVRGRAISGDTAIALSNQADGTQAGDASVVRLFPELGVGTNSFGQDIGTRADLDGNGTPDIVLNHQAASGTVGRFYTFFGEKLVGKEGQKVYVQPSGPVSVDGAQAGLNGVMYQKQQNLVLPLGDFDGAMFGEPSTIDLAYGVYSFTSYGKITVRLNHTGGAAGVVEGLLPFEDIVIRGPYADPPSDKFGVMWAPVGDFNGDGLTDLVVGTAGQGWAVIVY